MCANSHVNLCLLISYLHDFYRSKLSPSCYAYQRNHCTYFNALYAQHSKRNPSRLLMGYQHNSGHFEFSSRLIVMSYVYDLKVTYIMMYIKLAILKVA